jgi:hypothetical protein
VSGSAADNDTVTVEAQPTSLPERPGPGSVVPVPEVRPATAADVNSAGVVLPPGAEQALRELVGPAAKRGARRLLRRGVQEPLAVVLDPSKATAAGLRSKDLVLTKTKQSGQLLAQARDAKTGKVVENIPLKTPAEAGKGMKVASAGPTAAWQVMAIATQQHYLVEISDKLSGIDQRVQDLLAQTRIEKESELKAIEAHLRRLRDHLDNQRQLDPGEKANVVDWHKNAMSHHAAAISQAQRILNDDARNPADALPDLIVADRAARTMGLCAATILDMPYADADARIAEFWHYVAQTDEAFAKVGEVVMTLDVARRENFALWFDYVKHRPRTMGKRAWNATGGRLVKHVGPATPTFDFRKLQQSELLYIEQRARAAREQPVIGPATVLLTTDGARLLATHSA